MTDAVYEELSRAVCLSLLGRHRVGRIAGTVRDRPFVLPVNYALDGDRVVFRTAPGTKLDGTAFGRVAFEIDGTDEKTRTGWSVVVEGVATDVSEMLDDRSADAHGLCLEPWSPGEKSHLVAIHPESITGRWIRR